MKKTEKLWWIIPLAIFGAGLVSMLVRFFKGLGASTNLSDQFPWGLWVGFDVLCGVALAAGAFSLSAAVYVLHLDRYKPLVRAAILTGFIGYLLAILGLMFDLGHPYRIWHPLIMWNPHSVMFEISWCVTLYTLVLAMEFSEVVFEKIGLKRSHAITVPLVILGAILSTLHQSSLGSLFLIVPNKLHGLWYSPWLPVFFFSSAIAIGCAMIIVESFASSKVFKKELELKLLSDLGKILVVALAIYGVMRGMDLVDRNALSLILIPGFERNMFLAEILLAPIGPLALLLITRARINRFGLFMGALMTVVGFILNRFNVSMTGLVRNSGTKYIPSWMELSVTFSLVALGLVLFGLAVKYFNIFPLSKPCLSEGQSCTDKPSCCLPTLPRLLIVIIWTMVATLLITGIQNFRKFQPEKINSVSKISVQPAQNSEFNFSKLPPDHVFPQSETSPGKVIFSHTNHSSMIEKCTDCHGSRLKILPEQKPTSNSVLDMHLPTNCGRCHNGESASNDCISCHKTTDP